MKVWTITGFEGRWPVGTAAVVVAESPVTAALFLNNELEVHGLPRSAFPDDFQEMPTNQSLSRILCNGDY